MRDAFIEQLIESARTDHKIFLIIGDLGYGVVEEFAEQFPDRFLNSGVAEQSMMSLAAGLAATGYKVFVYSIANFPTFRCLEQIRNDISYHNRDVTIVGIGAGMGYGTLGYTHHAIEDLAIMRALPNMTVLSPHDPKSTKELVKHATSIPGPKYLRVGKNGEKNLTDYFDFTSQGFSATSLSQTQVTIATTGAIAGNAIEAKKQLEKNGTSTKVISISTVKPIDETLIDLLIESDALVILEEHSATGGLASTLFEQLNRRGKSKNALSIALSEHTVGAYNGSQNFLQTQNGLDSMSIYNQIVEYLQ